MFDKILIANRGEIALRVLRACKELGIASVAVHSTADEDAMHVRLADESVCIGPPAARDSYLNVPALLAACEFTGADAVHPGYGFLSENARFAEILAEHDIHFIGPKPAHIRLMGDKIEARRTAERLGMPVVPGSDGGLSSDREAISLAQALGFPVLVKAAAAGGEFEFSQRDVKFNGHAIECRINAENPVSFRPSPGKIVHYHPPGGLGVRVDSAVYHGYSIPPYYDSLVGKLIVHGKTRGECLMRLKRALDEFVIDGIETTLPLFRALVREKDVIDGDYHIRWLEEFLARGGMEG